MLGAVVGASLQVGERTKERTKDEGERRRREIRLGRTNEEEKRDRI